MNLHQNMSSHMPLTLRDNDRVTSWIQWIRTTMFNINRFSGTKDDEIFILVDSHIAEHKGITVPRQQCSVS